MVKEILNLQNSKMEVNRQTPILLSEKVHLSIPSLEQCCHYVESSDSKTEKHLNCCNKRQEICI